MSCVEELRRQFAIWSLAIFGTLSGSGSVQLASSAWGQDDPPAGAKADDKKESPPGDEASKNKPLDRAAVTQLLRDGKLAEAKEQIDQALANDPNGSTLMLAGSLASMLSATKPEDATRLYQRIIELAEPQLTKTSSAQLSAFAMASQGLASLMTRGGNTDDALKVLDHASERVSELQSESPMISSMTALRTSLLVRAGRLEEAKGFLDKQLQERFAKVAAEPNSVNRRALAATLGSYRNALASKAPEEVDKAYQAAETLLREATEAESATADDYSAYITLQISAATALADSSAKEAMAIIDRTEELGNKLADRLEDAEQRKIRAAQSSLKAATTRIKSKMLHESLVGQPAPEFDIEAVVNMEKASWADLKGKVVLIDFWAVWCGPCIATFPHLKHLKQEYGDKGLVIVGVTRQYGYVWDKEARKQVADKEATLDQELEMLEEFRKAHELEHGFVVTPKSSDFSSKFGVYGIPQAVLVDQNGVIQMIRVGSGDKNSKDLEEKIKSLLGV